jgi:hypothetical protein
MFELVLALVVFLGAIAVLAFLGAIVGFYIGAKHAAAQITSFFRRMIPSNDNDLSSIDPLLGYHSMLTLTVDVPLWQIACKLWAAAEQAHFRGLKPECSAIMKRVELEGAAWLTDTGLRVWHTPFRAADLLEALQAQGYRVVPQQPKSIAGARRPATSSDNEPAQVKQSQWLAHARRGSPLWIS